MYHVPGGEWKVPYAEEKGRTVGVLPHTLFLQLHGARQKNNPVVGFSSAPGPS